MNRFPFRLAAFAVGSAGLLATVPAAAQSPGCVPCRAGCGADLCGFPLRATGPLAPNGVFVREFRDRQTGLAALDKFFVLEAEWYKGGTTLGPAGRRHVDGLADVLRTGAGKIYVASGDDGKLDARRRDALVKLMADRGFADADARVVVARSRGEGLYGEDAVRIYPRLLQSGTGNRGGQGGGGFGGGQGGGIGGGFGGGVGTGGVR